MCHPLNLSITSLKFTKHLPNFLTICNLLCGCAGIVLVFQGNIFFATYLIWAAAIFDFFDGFVARWLKAYSAIGKELDSLADMVTFGVLPAIIMFHLLNDAFVNAYIPWIAFTIAACSALRLAKFNIDTRQTDSFIGLPTPANALLISALPFVIEQKNMVAEFIANGYVLLGITVIFSLLLVAELRLFALKFKNMSWHDNKVRFLFLALCIILIPLLQISAIPVIIFLYIVMSLPGSRTGL